jgi:predicted small secreted protein
MKRLFQMACVAGLLGLVAACNTVDGMGQDLQSGGDAISDTAQETERDM